MSSQNNLDVPGFRARLYNSLTFRMLVGLAIFVAVAFFSSLYVAKDSGRDVMKDQSEKLNESVVQTITLKLRERLAKTETLTRSLAQLGASLEKNESVIKRVIPQVLSDTGMDDLVAGGGIWPAPFTFDPKTERRSFFWGKNPEGDLEYFEDYNDPNGLGYHNEEWYVPALHLSPGQVYWSKSYIDPYSLEPMVTCTVPIWINDKIMGVATVDLRLQGLSDFMSEQASLTGGYAFAVDRNQRMLSKPQIEKWKEIESRLNRPENVDFPTLDDIKIAELGFEVFSEKLNRLSEQTSNAFSAEQAQRVDAVAQQISLNSYQVEQNESLLIAKQISTTEYANFSNNMFFVGADPLADESTTISIASLDDIGWHLIVAMPTRYADEAVNYISDRINNLLLLLLILASIFFMSFFYASFVLPLNRLGGQIRKRIKRHDYDTMLDIETKSELGELATSFNERTGHLRQAMSDLKQRNNDLEEMREVAEAANRSKSIFLASMSHEIRTPMNAIIGMSDALSEIRMPAEQSDYVKIIKTSSEGLLSLINDIMDFSKVEAGKLDLEEIPFDLRQILDDCADMIAFQAFEKQLDFVYFVSPKVPQKVIGDPNRVRQVVLNLMSNAVKFTSSGSIELWVECIHREGQSATLRIDVKDTGIGIDEDKLKQLFTPFVQSDSSTTRKFGGTGLGLAISKYLVDLMGGDIRYEPHPNGGSDFSFEVNLGIADQALRDQNIETTSSKTVYALVRSQGSANVIESYFQSMGYSVRGIPSTEHWIRSLTNEGANEALHLVWEISSLGDFDALLQSVPSTERKYQLLIVSSIHSNTTVDLSRLSSKFDVQLISCPLKYDDLVSAVEKASKQSGSQKVISLSKEWSEGREAPDSKQEPIDSGDDSTPPSSAKSGALQAYSDLKILVVEDNKLNQKVMMMLLDRLGLCADLAEDGLEAVDAATANQYDLILMDWQMPRMDGLEATQQIRKLPQYVATPIIAVTANAMAGDLDKCLSAGMNDYLSKPLRADELQTKLTRWLGESAGAKSSL